MRFLELFEDNTPVSEADIPTKFELNPAQRQLANIGRKLMDKAATTKDDALSTALSRVGNELTSYGASFGASSIQELEKRSGVSRASIMKMMDYGKRMLEKEGVSEAESDVQYDSGWQDYKGEKKDRFGNTIKTKNLAKSLAKSAKKDFANDKGVNEGAMDEEITKDSVKKSALELLVDIAKTSKQYKGEITDDQVHYLGSLVHDFDMAGIETEKYSEIEKLFRTASKTNKADMSMIQPAYAQAKTLNEEAVEEGAMSQDMWDSVNRGDKLTISYDSAISKDNKRTFTVTAKNIVGKAKVGKITMRPDEGNGKFFLYNRNGRISLAMGDMAADMTRVEFN